MQERDLAAHLKSRAPVCRLTDCGAAKVLLYSRSVHVAALEEGDGLGHEQDGKHWLY